METFIDLLRRFREAEVEFVVIGGMAVVYHGSSLVTQDLDVCAPFTPDNVPRILNAIDGLNARFYPRPDLPIIRNEPEKFVGYKNLYLRTDLGKLDILGELPGVGTYDEIKERVVEVDVDGIRLRVLDLDTLIAAKRFAGRARDFRAISELEEIRSRLPRDA